MGNETNRLLLPIKSISPTVLGDKNSVMIELDCTHVSIQINDTQPLVDLLGRVTMAGNAMQSLPGAIRSDAYGGSRLVVSLRVGEAIEVGIAPAEALKLQSVTPPPRVSEDEAPRDPETGGGSVQKTEAKSDETEREAEG